MLLFTSRVQPEPRSGAISLRPEPALGGASHCGGSHLHDAVPVVTCGDSEEGQEGHAKVPKGGMPARPLAKGCVSSHSEEEGRERLELAQESLSPQPWLLCPPHPNSPRSPKSSTPRAAKMKNNSMKRSPKFPPGKEEEQWKRRHQIAEPASPTPPGTLSLPGEGPFPPTPTSQLPGAGPASLCPAVPMYLAIFSSFSTAEQDNVMSQPL